MDASWFSRSLTGAGDRLHELAAGNQPEVLATAARAIAERLSVGSTVFFFGNGGSAGDAQHLAAELIGRFGRPGRGYAGVALTTDSSNITAIANDFGYEQVFSRQIEALGRPGDVAVGISTSGRSTNVIRAIEAARANSLRTIAFTGPAGGPLADAAEFVIRAPGEDTTEIQTCHIALGQLLLDAAIGLAEGGPQGEGAGDGAAT